MMKSYESGRQPYWTDQEDGLLISDEKQIIQLPAKNIDPEHDTQWTAMIKEKHQGRRNCVCYFR